MPEVPAIARTALAWQGTSRSAAETRELGARLAGVAHPGDRIGLVGDLGAGKTEFARGFARGLGVRAVVSSPSFTLMQEYAGRLPLFHIDVYRLAGSEDALAGGLLDERQDEGVSLIEWADRLDGPLAVLDATVRIDAASDETRWIRVEAPDASGSRFVEAARDDGVLRGEGPAA
jgi:tRNA threonylcarbamoyladenosine biosynthesis protein TsaE